MIDQEKSTKLKVLKPKLKLDADEGVARGNGASPLDQRGEPLEDPFHLGPEVGGRPHQRLQQLLHLLPQDQEASRVLGEAQSRVSEILGGMGVGGFPSNLADCILIPAGVVRCGETWGRFMLGGKYLEWSDPLFLLHPTDGSSFSNEASSDVFLPQRLLWNCIKPSNPQDMVSEL